MKQFSKSTAGRLIALAFAVALIGGGVSALMPHGATASFVFCASLFVPVVLCVAGLPTAVEGDWYHAVLAVIVLPPLLFLWAVGIGVVRDFHPMFAYPSIALGIAALALAARPMTHAGMFPPRLAHQH